MHTGRRDREQINRKAWAEATLLQRAAYEELRQAALVQAKLTPASRRRRGRPLYDPLQQTILDVLATNVLDGDDELLDALEAYLDKPGDRPRRVIIQLLGGRAAKWW